jgi:hypothetical protein
MSKMISQPMVCSVQTKHVSCAKINTIPRHLGVPSNAPKMISEPISCSTQIVYLSCIEINIVTKQTQTCFHLTHITKEYHQVCPKWFLSLWYVRRKPSTYLALRLTLSPYGPIRASTWPTSHRSTIGFVQNDFWAYCTFGASCAPILRRH